jgi:hypothetical protein
VGRAALGRRVDVEKNAFVLFALFNALLERRATAPREVNMVKWNTGTSGSWVENSQNLASNPDT